MPGIALALNEVHLAGVFHADLKIENILVMEEPKEQPGSAEDWKIVIADFGLSRVLGEEELILKRMGTVQYMAPEMIHPTGKLNEFRVTRCADIWSLGIIFYYLIWGKFPDKHQGERMSEILCNI